MWGCPHKFFTSGPQDIRNRTGCPYLSDLGYKVNLKVRLQQNYIKGDTSINLQQIGNIVAENTFLYERTDYRLLRKENKIKFIKKYAKHWNGTDDAEPCGYCDDGCELCDYTGTRYWSTPITSPCIIAHLTSIITISAWLFIVGGIPILLHIY